GAGVTSVAEGDPVAVFGAWGCGHCGYCVRGEEQLCLTPSWAGLSAWDGGYADYLLVPHQRHLVRLDRLTPREAAPLTGAALTPYRAIRRALPAIDPERPILQIGLGGLGRYGLQLLRLLSGAPVIVVEVSPEKRELARTLGAAHVLDGADPELASKVADVTRGEGVAAAFDYVGADATLALAIGNTAALGRVVQVGLAGGAARLKALENV